MPARKIEGWWYADFYAGKKRYRERSPQNTALAARAYEQFLRGEIAKMGSLKHLEPQKQPEKKVVLTFAEFADRWLRDYVAANHRWSEQRQRMYTLRSRLVPFFGRLRLDEVTSERIETYKADIQRAGASKKTVNNHLTILRKCLGIAVEWRELDTVPHFKILRVKLPPFNFLHPPETLRLLQELPAGLWRTMALVAVRTGLRYSELIALRWGDIDFTTKLICVQRAEVRKHTGPTKNDCIRYVPMTSEVMQALRSLQTSKGRVFELNGGSIWYETAWKRLRNASRAAGLRHVSWHDFRHTFATDLVRRKVPLPAVQKLLGHATIEMTLRYTHIDDESLHEAIAQLEPGQAWAAYGRPKDELLVPPLPPAMQGHQEFRLT